MLIRQLHPEPAQVDTLDAYAVPAGRRHLRANMVSSVDGAGSVDGRVGVLTGTADQRLLHELRALCDVLLVGAGTIRAEGYGPLELDESEQRRRMDRGQAPLPRLAVLSRTLDLDLTAPVFTEATARPLVVTTHQAPVHRREAAAEVADLITVGDSEVDLAGALDELAAVGLSHVLSEGGPHVLAQLFAAGLVDELCLAVAPVLVGGPETRITAGASLTPPAGLALTGVCEQDGFLFLRYVRAAR